ncbi:MAG: hypothetical protein WAL90_11975 [Desulfobacterales bacterium]
MPAIRAQAARDLAEGEQDSTNFLKLFSQYIFSGNMVGADPRHPLTRRAGCLPARARIGGMPVEYFSKKR